MTIRSETSTTTMTTAPSTNPVDDYARAVVAGEIRAGKYHRLSCARHLRDRARENTPEFPYVFVWEAHNKKGKLKRQCALHFITFARRMKHYKGRQFAGQPFEPTPVQVFRLGSIFGWRQVGTGYRRFTTAYNEVPRKHGKSFEEAVVSVYCTFFEGEAGAEGYCIATKEKQAKIAFSAAKRLVKSSGLSSRIKVNASNLHREKTECKLEPIGSDSDTTDGLNPHFVGVDEYHAFKTRGLLDVMESALGARVNPMNFQITTAGKDPLSPCGDQHDYACRILDGVLEDDPATLAFFAFIAHADKDDDPWAEETWRKACPHWGVSVNPEEIRKMAAKAKQMPAAASEFKQKILNIWDNSIAPCLSVDGWRTGQSVGVSREAFELALEHEPCYIGVDLASKLDLCALAAVFPPAPGRPKWHIVRRIWTPNDTLEERAHRDKVPLTVWAEQGWLTGVHGKSIDKEVVRETINEFRERYDIIKVGFDPWHDESCIRNLVNQDGFSEQDVIEVPQTFAGMSTACLRMQAEILEASVDAGGCPVTAWAVSCAVGNQDGKANLMFTKDPKKMRGRIDPLIASTIGMALWLKQPERAVWTGEIRVLGQ
jgi:phage terminase large subunit-like protein